MAESNTYKPMTRRQRLEHMADMLGKLTGKELHVTRWNPGDGTKYSVEEGGNHYSPWLPLGELETALEFALKVAYDVKQS